MILILWVIFVQLHHQLLRFITIILLLPSLEWGVRLVTTIPRLPLIVLNLRTGLALVLTLLLVIEQQAELSERVLTWPTVAAILDCIRADSFI